MSDDINVNYIADQLAKKVDLPDNKGQDGIDYVVEWKAPTSSDPTWYRVYKSGWVEQGGKVKLNGAISSTNLRITFPKKMSYTNYYCCGTNDANNGTSIVLVGWQKIDSMSIGTTSGTGTVSWEVKGQGA